MSMPTEHVEALHQITAELKAEHEALQQWLSDIGASKESHPLTLTRAEGERIFADRIAKHEGRLKELGWERKIRVEPAQEVAK